MGGFIPGLSILFHWSIFLSLCEYHTVLMTVGLWYRLKSGRLIPPVPFFFLKIALAIQGFCISIEIVKLFVPVIWKNTIGSLIGITLDLNYYISIVNFVFLPYSKYNGSFTRDLKEKNFKQYYQKYVAIWSVSKWSQIFRHLEHQWKMNLGLNYIDTDKSFYKYLCASSNFSRTYIS